MQRCKKKKSDVLLLKIDQSFIQEFVCTQRSPIVALFEVSGNAGRNGWECNPLSAFALKDPFSFVMQSSVTGGY